MAVLLSAMSDVQENAIKHCICFKTAFRRYCFQTSGSQTGGKLPPGGNIIFWGVNGGLTQKMKNSGNQENIAVHGTRNNFIK